MNDITQMIISHGVALAFGLAIGEFLSWRHKGNGLTLEIEAREVWNQVVKKVAWVTVVVVFMASIIQSVLFTYTQRECNDRVVDTLNYRSTLGDSDRKLSDQKDNAIFQMVATLLTLQPGGPVTARQVLENFVTERTRIDKAAEENDKERQANPLPDCS